MQITISPRRVNTGVRKSQALSLVLASLVALVISAVWITNAQADTPGFVFPNGCCYYNGEVVRTVVPPAAMTKEGKDNFYAVPGQKAVVAVAPGDKNYHGGKWKFHSVTWNVTPRVLTSAAAVLAAEDAGDVNITRVKANDFKCPIQP